VTEEAISTAVYHHSTDEGAMLAERAALPATWLALIIVFGIATPSLFLTWSATSISPSAASWA
jgi:hypothetical protein